MPRESFSQPVTVPGPFHGLLIALSIALAACGGGDGGAMLPEALGAEWTLITSRAGEPSEAAPGGAELGLDGLIVATYAGPGDPVVIVHEMGSGSSAFEMAQRWRAEAGAIAFQSDSRFVVVRAPSLDQAALNRFADALERAWQGGN
jgi:hypothetical protein